MTTFIVVIYSNFNSLTALLLSCFQLYVAPLSSDHVVENGMKFLRYSSSLNFAAFFYA